MIELKKFWKRWRRAIFHTSTDNHAHYTIIQSGWERRVDADQIVQTLNIIWIYFRSYRVIMCINCIVVINVHKYIRSSVWVPWIHTNFISMYILYITIKYFLNEEFLPLKTCLKGWEIFCSFRRPKIGSQHSGHAVYKLLQLQLHWIQPHLLASVIRHSQGTHTYT